MDCATWCNNIDMKALWVWIITYGYMISYLGLVVMILVEGFCFSASCCGVLWGRLLFLLLELIVLLLWLECWVLRLLGLWI